MLPLAMNELVQKNLKDVGIDVDLQPIEWNSLTQRFRAGFTGENQDAILAKLHERVVEEAPWIFIVHDLNPRAMSAKVKGFVPPQSWFVDLTQVSVTR
jgi:ABC-type transport system substrate-binding protein